MRKIIASIVFIGCFYLLKIAVSDNSMKGITEYRHQNSGFFSSSKLQYGDLFGICYLKDFKIKKVEHVDKPHKFISSCIACVKPGGSLFLSTINRTTKSYTIAILGAESILKILPAGTHDWHKFITPDELSLLVTTPLKIDANNEYNDQYIIPK
jgi:ubiquinone biosynthesis O-methyltransferase